jgi:tetratricopeptide (TPR) repeat protein
MVSERMQRRVDALLDEADVAVSAGEWVSVAEKARAVLAIDEANEDALGFLKMAQANGVAGDAVVPLSSQTAEAPSAEPAVAQPDSFAGGRYVVERFLGEGGKKRVYLAHDELLDRDVAFALIKTEGLDEVGRERVVREAQAMGRMGVHPHIVSILDFGEADGAPYVVTELMGGGDVEGLLEDAEGPLPLAQSLDIAKATARGLVFAHEQGVVHRDLKPGNVWLTADGVAKIGDFGLAVAEGRSRLTQHGMMVGTFGYMPPEQALGQEVTPQADLYSLGAMLYELVTGNPPFAGDDATAVISQHINTAPVRPSLRSEHCPPDLEALILGLLAKAPDDRPTSATEVVEALEGVDPEARSESDSQLNPLDRLARGVFVGREAELERLRTAADEAFAGRGSVVMLVGEPGIGKTRTAQELHTYARMRGAEVLWGRAHESSGAPPYWPWVQIARAHRDLVPDEVRRRQYEPYAVELQRIFPGLRELFPNLPEPPPIESDEGQFRLFDAFSAVLRSVASETPLALVLDDLHWADRATLQLLTHLARDLAQARILVVGTYRDTDLDRQHPLSGTLAELNREQLFERISLRGLDRPEMTSYVAAVAGIEPPPVLMDRIEEETEGNPFFLGEVVNLMAEGEAFGFEHRQSFSDIAIPEGVKEALGRRLDRLSSEANELLGLASVAGREFEHRLLAALTEHGEEQLLQLLEEALAARVVEETERIGEYRFTHALMQETLVGELSSARRVLLHGQIADALVEIYGTENRDHLREIAEHYAESAVLNPEHARAAASTLRLAAGAAGAALAWDEAARLYERCLELVPAAADSEDEGALWLSLAQAHVMLTDFGAGISAIERAADLPGTDLRDLSAAVMRIMASLPTDQVRVSRALWARLAEAAGDEPSLTAYRLNVVLAVADDGPDGAEAAARARTMASQIDSTDAIAALVLEIRECLQTAGGGDIVAALERLESLRPQAMAAGAEGPVIIFRRSWTVMLGDLDGGDALYAEAVATFKRTGQLAFAELYEAGRARLDWHRGRLSRSRDWIDELPAGPSSDMARAEVMLVAGDAASALRALPPENHPRFSNMNLIARSYRGLRCQILLAAGRSQEAQAAFDAWREGYEVDSGWTAAAVLGSIDDAPIALADRELLTELLERYERFEQFRYTSYGTSPDYARGAMALALDRIDDAERWFNTGLEWASKWDLDTFIGRNHYGLAEVAERRDDLDLAMQHLDAAGELFAKRGAKLYLDQVLAKKEILRA